MFILTVTSLIISVLLKFIGYDWFKIEANYSTSNYTENIINGIMMFIQYYLIVGIVTRLPFKKLFIKMLPYFPLNILLFFINDKNYFLACFIIMFSTCIAIKPKFSTLLKFSINLIIVFIMQIILIWLKFDKSGVIFTSAFNVMLVNIDQFILLSLLYYINRMRGE